MLDSTIQTEVDQLLQQHPNTEAIDLLISDLNGIVRGKRIDISALNKVADEGVALPASVFSLDATGNTIEECGLGLHIGEPDRTCLVSPGSLQPIPWQKRPMAQALMSMYEADGTPFFADPRHVLASVLDKFKALGLTPVIAVELEFYLIDSERSAQGYPQPPLSPKTGKREQHKQVYSVDLLDEYGDFLDDIAAFTAAQNIPADTAVVEYAPGQFEINLKHQNDPLAACDNAVLLKRAIKAVAGKHGMEASFMAKPYEEEAGNGMHVHISLVNEQGDNAFSATGQRAEAAEMLNQTMAWAIAGVLQLMPESMALFCPNVNSYRRLRPEYYVPMAANWGIDNRTTAVRIPNSPAHARRLEHRVSGADANPYLVVAAILASMHYGICQQQEPGKPAENNAFDSDSDSQKLPIRLTDALQALEQSDILREYFGDAFINLYTTSKQGELSEFERHVTALETQWFLTTF